MRRLLTLLFALLLFGGGLGYGVLVHRNQIFPYELIKKVSGPLRGESGSEVPLGRWRTRDGLTSAQQAEMEQLAALGYLSGTQSASGGESGVLVLDPERAQPGLNLYSSGHAPEALLIDMEGKTLHRWRYEYQHAFPEQEPDAEDFRVEFWRKIHPYPNGDMLAIFEGLGIVKVDRDSELLWALHNTAHHDIVVADDGTIYILTREPRVVPEVHESRPVLEDFITVLNADGEELARHSVLQALLDSDFASLMDFSEKAGDILHTNTLRILDGSHVDLSPHFKAGNALVSLPKLNTVAVIDLNENKVVWVLSGLFKFQHDSQLLENGNLLVFDNIGNGGFSKVVEVNPASQEILWGYYGDEDNAFFSACCGTTQRLDNGNTLITESESGRAFELTPAGDRVWLFESPHRAGDDGELVATLNEVERLAPDFGAEWLKR